VPPPVAQIAAGPVSLVVIIEAVSGESFGSLKAHSSSVYGASIAASTGIALSEKSRTSEQPEAVIAAVMRRASEDPRTMGAR